MLLIVYRTLDTQIISPRSHDPCKIGNRVLHLVTKVLYSHKISNRNLNPGTNHCYGIPHAGCYGTSASSPAVYQFQMGRTQIQGRRVVYGDARTINAPPEFRNSPKRQLRKPQYVPLHYVAFANCHFLMQKFCLKCER